MKAVIGTRFDRDMIFDTKGAEHRSTGRVAIKLEDISKIVKARYGGCSELAYEDGDFEPNVRLDNLYKVQFKKGGYKLYHIDRIV